MTYLEAMQLLAAKAPSVAAEAAKTIRRLAGNTTNAQAMAERIIEYGLSDSQAELTTDERTDLASLLSGDAAAASTVRQRRRRQALDEAAQMLGFGTWTKLETAVIDGRLKLTGREQ